MKPVYPEKHSAVAVTWTDTMAREGWRYGSDILAGTCPVIQSLGHVVNVTREHIALSSGLDKRDGSALTVTLIPWGCVKALKVVHF